MNKREFSLLKCFPYADGYCKASEQKKKNGTDRDSAVRMEHIGRAQTFILMLPIGALCQS